MRCLINLKNVVALTFSVLTCRKTYQS